MLHSSECVTKDIEIWCILHPVFPKWWQFMNVNFCFCFWAAWNVNGEYVWWLIGLKEVGENAVSEYAVKMFLEENRFWKRLACELADWVDSKDGSHPCELASPSVQAPEQSRGQSQGGFALRWPPSAHVLLPLGSGLHFSSLWVWTAAAMQAFLGLWLQMAYCELFQPL